jgi:choloylglycine hydrolase
MMNHLKKYLIIFVLALQFTFVAPYSHGCTRVLYETGTGSTIVGRSMDWSDTTAATDFWIFPRQMERNGGVGEGSMTWTSKYGSVIISFYDAATVDGMNEKGLVANVLYLAESDYGDPNVRKNSKLSAGAWAQYVLDNFQSVDEAVKALNDNPITIVTTKLPNGRAASGHLSLSDSTGDSAIFEYIGGKLQIHHGRDYTVMTNSPIYSEQLAINTYWDLVGGNHFLPGTISAADRFVRASYNLKASPKFSNEREALASVFSQMRAVGVPLGMSDPDKPNIASTLWRSIAVGKQQCYYFDSVINPSVIWVDFTKVDFTAGKEPKTLKLNVLRTSGGEVSSEFTAAKPFKWLAPSN